MVKTGKKKKVLAGKAQATTSNGKARAQARREARIINKEERRAHKLERRKKEKQKENKNYWDAQWAVPAPSNLVARLDVPKVKSKYQSYFEIADNPERKEKKLDFTVTDNAIPPPGFTFVPIGDPILTNQCKELSRERGAMIFIVSTDKNKEEDSKISAHIYRTGYHFRETIAEAARDIIGERVISKPTAPGFVEPIPESQAEINKQADGAIRDLFPRIPHTDRVMIIEHAFKKGGLFHGEPTVGLAADIPLSRRVQLAVLSHIRHTHTRYDKLLRETTWMNARKAVEPVCLDVLLKWRGDEETGRDQMDEILREVVIITDSEADDSESSDEDSSDDEGEVTSISSTEEPALPASRVQDRQIQPTMRHAPTMLQGPGQVRQNDEATAISSRTRSKADDKRAQRGFQRYQAALDGARDRALQRPRSRPTMAQHPPEHLPAGSLSNSGNMHDYNKDQYTSQQHAAAHSTDSYQHNRGTYHERGPPNAVRPVQYYSQQGLTQGPFGRDEVFVRSHVDRPIYYQQSAPRFVSPSHATREQRPPQVVRGSPIVRGPEDMPLPSIEPASSNIASPVRDQRVGVHELGNQPQDSYPRRLVDQRLKATAPRDVIVLDDSPVKRRRFAYEDDHVPFRDHDMRVPASSSSRFVPVSFIQSGEASVRYPVSSNHHVQGLVRRISGYYTDPATGERLPVYDAPEPRHYAQPSEHRVAAEPGRRLEDRREQPPASLTSYGDDIEVRSLARTRDGHEQTYATERDQYRQHHPDHQYESRGRPLQENSRHQEPSMFRPHHGTDIPAGSDQALVHSFSQSRLDGPSLARDGFVLVSERQHEEPSYGHMPDYDSRQARPISRATRERTPVQYMEPSRSRQDDSHQSIYRPSNSNRRVPTDQPMRSGREQLPLHSADVPSYNRPCNTMQNVYVID